MHFHLEGIFCTIFFCFSQWHNLSREEQTKYYDMAKKERQLHMQLYPGWSARDNYAINAKKKKKKRDKSQDGGKLLIYLFKLCIIVLSIFTMK